MDNGKVYLVGAGPGDADLLTLRGSRLLQSADCIVYDKLIDAKLLQMGRPEAERIYVGKQASYHCLPQTKINELLIECARRGKTVVRLKGGDPLLFARGGEEALALKEAGIDYEIVPGVTAALAAAATSGIPLTHRGVASAVAFVTGHEDPSKPDSLDWKSLAAFPGTVVVYMALRRIGAVCKELIAAGRSADCPVALVEWGGTNRQKVHASTVERLANGEPVPLASPALAVIGQVCQFREQIGWIEKRPLFGQTILLPRAAEQADETAQVLQELGAVVICEPVFEILPPDDWQPVDQCLQELATFDWLVFTSRNGVTSFLGRLLQQRDLRALANLKIAAIGPGTAAELERFHLKADLIPDDFRAEALADALSTVAKGKRILIARANRGRQILVETLSAVASEVTQVTVYRQVDRLQPSAATAELLREGKIDVVLLSSSNMASGFFRWLDETSAQHVRQRTRLISISPITTQRIREEGFEAALEAQSYTLQGMIDVLLQQ